MADYNKSLEKKMETKKHIGIILSAIIVVLVIGNLLNINYRQKEANFKVEKGVVDLSSWNIDGEEIIKLDREWEFYSGKLLHPKEDFHRQRKEYIEIPGSWESSLRGQGLENGCGTYRLRIRLREDGVYGIKSRTIRVANRIYLNGEEVTQAGNPSIDEKN